MRVLVITPDFPPGRGGIETLVHRLVANWRRCEPWVVTLDQVGAEGFDRGQAFTTTRVRPVPRLRPASVLRLNAAAIRQAFRYRPDAVMSAHVVAAPATRAIGRILRVPFLQYVYGLEVAARPRLSAFAVRHARMVVAISRHTRELALAVGASPERVKIIPPGVDLPPEVLRTPADRPTLVTVAQLEYRYKGHDVVARALPLVRAAVPDVEWVIVGDGVLRPYVESMIAAHGLERSVRLLGSVSDAERDAWLRRAHLMVMPSRIPADSVGGEGYGMVYTEAAAHGLPVVAGNVGGTRDAVRHGQTGLLVDPEDHLAVADATIELMRNSERANAMGRAGRELAASLAWPRIAQRVEDLVLGFASSKVN
jgi:phosphatidylinositol alpha-1,6-mannosyltransferase